VDIIYSKIYSYKLKLCNILYNVLSLYVLSVTPDDGGRPKKHVAGNIVCICVLFGQVDGFDYKKHNTLRE